MSDPIDAILRANEDRIAAEAQAAGVAAAREREEAARADRVARDRDYQYRASGQALIDEDRRLAAAIAGPNNDGYIQHFPAGVVHISETMPPQNQQPVTMEDVMRNVSARMEYNEASPAQTGTLPVQSTEGTMAQNLRSSPNTFL